MRRADGKRRMTMDRDLIGSHGVISFAGPAMNRFR
jgi:hypothetical protein